MAKGLGHMLYREQSKAWRAWLGMMEEQAAMAKWYSTEKQVHLIDRCLQLHGGYGYMREYDVARAYLDARVQTIYGGTTEIMKEIIGRSLGV